VGFQAVHDFVDAPGAHRKPDPIEIGLLDRPHCFAVRRVMCHLETFLRYKPQA
jgi:hypothetical protein